MVSRSDRLPVHGRRAYDVGRGIVNDRAWISDRVVVMLLYCVSRLRVRVDLEVVVVL